MKTNLVNFRIEYYKQFAWYLYVDYSNETLGCAKQKQFSAGGSGALPIYWDKVLKLFNFGSGGGNVFMMPQRNKIFRGFPKSSKSSTESHTPPILLRN